ncbi:MAG: trimethylamine-N-oxide reductase [Burkholderia sp.]|jgi:trimethylamine-N-oxide reductase (cytochrome c)
MTGISRRSLFGATAAAGLSAAVPAARAAKVPGPEEHRFEGNPAAKGSAAKFQPVRMDAPEMKLSGTFDLGKSTLNEGEALTASRWGIVRAHVQGGKMTHLTPFEFDYAPSPNLNGLCQLPYSPSRIRFPMVRESYLKNGPASRDKRGEDKWVRVSWDKALDLVASEMKRIYGKYGPSAMFGRSYGWMSTGMVNAAITLQNRLLSLCGGYIHCINSYSTAAISRILPYVIGSSEAASTSWDNVLKHSERIVLWGCDPLVTNDIDWFTTIHNGAGYFRALKENKNIKTISINPLQTDTAEYLGSEWIAPRPGTDCAMMLGMMYELETSGKADHAFLEKYTYGWNELRDYIMGKSDGVKKTPQWAASKCGVPAERIISLAHEMQEHRTMIMMGWGIQRTQYGEQPHWMGYALASVLGQIGLPGGGIGTNYHYSNGGAPTGYGPFVGGIPGAPDAVLKPAVPYKGSKVIPVARFVDCILNPGKTIDFNGTKVTYPEVRMVMWAGGNPFTHQPETMKLERAFKKPDTVVVTDYVWTATARHADIVLPACTVFEHNDITSIGTYSHDGIIGMHQAIEPRWESKPDYWIFSQLAKRMGVEKEFTEGLDEMGWIRRLYNNAKKMGDRVNLGMPEFDEFWKKGYIMFDVRPESRDYVAFAKFREDPKKNALATESGLIQLFSPKIAGYKYDDCLGHPSYFEPSEGVNTATKAAPLALMACKSRYRMHSQLDGTVSHDFANIQGR